MTPLQATSAPGRFERVLGGSFESLGNPAVSAASQTDLMAVTYEPTPWNQRVLLPWLKRGALALGMLGTLAAGAWVYGNHYRAQERQAALVHLQQTSTALEMKDLARASQEVEQALVAARHSQDSAVIESALQQSAAVAGLNGRWLLAVQRYEEMIQRGGQASENLAEASRNWHKAERAVAQTRLKEARNLVARGDYATALKFTAEADRLLSEHQGSPSQLAESHYLNGLVFERLGLEEDARQHLRQALTVEPGHARSRTLLAKLTAPKVQASPEPAPVSRPVVPVSQPEVSQPRLDMGAGYPTYRPRDDEDEERDKERSSSSSSSSSSSRERSRRTRSRKSSSSSSRY